METVKDLCDSCLHNRDTCPYGAHSPVTQCGGYKKSWNRFASILKCAGKYITVDGNTISIMVQDGPIKEVGENGVQVDALGEIWKEIIEYFNNRFPCLENERTLKNINLALKWQEKRKKNREKRNVEGKDLK